MTKLPLNTLLFQWLGSCYEVLAMFEGGNKSWSIWPLGIMSYKLYAYVRQKKHSTYFR